MSRKKRLPAFIILSFAVASLLTYGILTYHDFILVSNSAYYADGPTGYAGTIPPALHAFNRLKANPFAEYIFKRIEMNGTSPAKAYAIMALKDLDPEYADNLIEKYRVNRETVEVYFGCLVGSVDLSELFHVSTPIPTAESYCKAYYQKYTELVNQYGKAQAVEAEINNNQHSYLEGVCVAELLDFNGDGIQDFFVIYSNGQYTGRQKSDSRNDEYDIIIPQAGSYEIEVWTLRGGELIQLLHLPRVGSYRSFDIEYWNTDNCMVTVFGNADGIPVIQLNNTSKKRLSGINLNQKELSYTNIYWNGDSFVTDELHYFNGSYTCNGKPITEKIWNEQITGYDAILFLAKLSDPDWIIDYSRVLDRTEDIAQALSQNEEPIRLEPVQNAYIPLYLQEIDRSNRERTDLGYEHPTIYSLYDINQNGTPELLIRNGNDAAGYNYDVFTATGSEIIHCGEFNAGHSSLMTGQS